MARTGATRLLASALLGVLLPLGAWRLFRRNFSLSRLLLIPPTIGALVAAIFGVPLNPDALRDQPWERLAHGLMMMTLSLPLALIIGCATRGQARLALTLLVAVIATHAAIVDVWLNLDAWRHGDFHYVSSGWAQPWFYALFANGCAIIAFFVIRGVVRVIGRLFVWIAWMRGTRLATLRG